jgi:glycosyltransferase involved in cell wall biosynthesis
VVRILFLNVTGALGGAERLLLDVLASLRQTDPALELHLALAADGPLAAAARARDVVVHLLPLPERLLRFGEGGPRATGGLRRTLSLLMRGPAACFSAWRYARQLGRFIDSLDPDVVHSNSLKLHLLSALARPRRATLVWHLHDFVGDRALSRRGLRWAARRAAGAVAVSGAVADDAGARLVGLPIETVRNAIDTERFTAGPSTGEQLDALAGLSPAAPGTVRVGLVATYATWKGHDVFLDAAHRIRTRHGESMRFYIVGGPIYQTTGSQWDDSALRTLAARVPGRDAVGFAGFQADTVPIYRGLDVVVHASTRPEPFGLTVAEAMSCGRAVIVAQAGGAAELFTHDHDAMGVAPGDAGAVAETIEILARDTERRRRLGEQARRTAVARFDRARLGPELLAAYDRFRGTAELRTRSSAGLVLANAGEGAER